MTIHSLTFVHPAWLLAGLLASAAIIVLGLRADRQRKVALAMFSSRRNGSVSSLSRPLRILKRALLCAGVLSGCVAAARPQRGFRWEEAHRRGIDILFALDTSKSMLAPDVKPDRLTRAKLAIHDLVAKFEGDRVGLVAFAGDAFLQCPLTLDRAMFDQTLDAVDSTMIPRGGTDVGRAIEVAEDALHNEPTNQKLLVFLTDGEDLESHAIEAAGAASKNGIRVYTVGVGTPGGELIPLAGGPGRFVRDESGAFVRSRLDEKTLQAMAAAAGGDYRQLGADGHGLEGLYQDVLAKLPQEALGSRMRQVPLERFQWPLGCSIMFLALEPLVRERRRRGRIAADPPKKQRKLAVVRRRAAAAVAIGLSAVTTHLVHASPRDGERAYRDGRYQKAAEEYEHAVARAPGDAQLQYNLGTAAYKSGDFARAGAALEHALRADRLELQQNAYYDIGNTLFRIGQKTVEKQPEQTIEQWKRSIASYESALKLNGKDADAVYNRELVRRKLAELERQQEQQKNQQQKNQQGQKEKQDKQGQQDKQNQQGQEGQQGQHGQQAQNQQGQQGQKDKQNQQGQQGQQAQNQQGQKDKQQQGQDPRQAQSPPAGQKQASAPADSGTEDGDQKGEAAVPGKLSRSDARAVLDALRGDERLLPIAPVGQRHATAEEPVRKDW